MIAPLRTRLGAYGAWLHPGYGDAARTEFATEAEQLGYPTVWLGLGTASIEDLAPVEQILKSTTSIIVATAIVNMWTNDAAAIAKAYRRLNSTYGDRLLLGVGIGHPEAVSTYRTPYTTMVDYLDRLDAGGVPADGRILAALGPRALRLAADRTLGTHPYLVVPEHTREARAMLGPEVVVAPEQTVVLDPDPLAARKIARTFVSDPYLRLSNYTNNLRRYGYTDADLEGEGSDRLIDALVPHGSTRGIASSLRDHLAAGADHIGIQILTADGASPMPGYRALASTLFGS
ncbi:TIGR03620 family F420-dependent LLM class oxidoreductase [Mycobacterium stomatepiae]|uniref:LLM class F420-dependent oxidoreductase n=1 Tax=Mycobacterium stomatepiae TaxID=470076 RepID=A0A7I7Q9X8_9MYCO|nr:TIGR03620 family F420-dependent LLM class oxidoreductase [Mycobacterium stomatepiae]MCV7168240.1 TIGR03620 family F420-dependent LLM class oxidoreductase [Mycobacterium stomatepiae]BBY23128.1 LLM class F420-dependent oxidoreductase [Mycobacterium stomatepiae]